MEQVRIEPQACLPKKIIETHLELTSATLDVNSLTRHLGTILGDYSNIEIEHNLRNLFNSELEVDIKKEEAAQIIKFVGAIIQRSKK